MRKIENINHKKLWSLTSGLIVLGLLVAVCLITKQVESILDLMGKEQESVSAYNQSSPSPLVENISSESELINSLHVSNSRIENDDIAPGAVNIDNFDKSFKGWVSQVNKTLPQNQNLLQKLLQDNLGFLRSLDILKGGIQIDNLAPDVADILNNLESSIDNLPSPFELAEGIIQTAHIASGAITGPLIADGVIGNSKLALGSIDGNNIIDGAIGTIDLADSAITNLKLADGSINTAKILDGGITINDLSSGSVGTTQLLNNAVTGLKILDGSLLGDDLAASSIDNSKLVDGSIDLSKLAGNSVGSSQLIADSITNAKILDGSISTNDIASGAITGALIAPNTISALHLANGAITSGSILDGAISSVDIADGAVGSNQLANNVISNAKILDGTIDTSDIASGAITSSLLGNGSVLTSKLSAAANRRIVAVQIGDIASLLGSLVERPVFIAPSSGTINKITFTNGANINLGVNKGTISLLRKTGSDATVASVDLTATSLSAFTANTPGLGGGTNFNTGDIYSFKYQQGFLGVALSGFLVTIEYTPNE